MIIVGENINIMSKTIGPAMREKQAGPILELAAQMGGADYLDLNLGPARKTGAEIMPWLVETVQMPASRPAKNAPSSIRSRCRRSGWRIFSRWWGVSTPR